MDTVCVKQFIFCNKQRRGKGTEYSPIRRITEIFDMDGNLVATEDIVGDITPESMMEFLKYHYPEYSEDKHREKIAAYYCCEEVMEDVVT